MSTEEAERQEAPINFGDALPQFLYLLPEAVRALVLGLADRRDYEFGDVIVAEDEDSDALYIIVSGSARVIRRGPGGQEVSLRRFGPGDFFGESGLITGELRTATVRASSPVVAARLDARLLLTLMGQYPEIRAALEIQQRARTIDRFIRTQSVFAALSNETMARLVLATEEVRVEPGQVIVEEGDEANFLFVVEHGRLEVSSTSTGSRRVVKYLRSGDMFGEAALEPGRRRTASVTALEPASLLRANGDSIRGIAAEHRDLARRISETVAARRRLTHAPLDFVGELVASDAEQTRDATQPNGATADPDLARVSESPEAAPEPDSTPVRVRRNVFVHQLDEMDCGAACLGMVARAYGRAASLTLIRQESGVGISGTTLRGLRRGGAAIGIDMKAYRVSPDHLHDIRLPAILHWEGNHWVVLFEVGDVSARIGDPAVGMRRVSLDELDAKWTGYAVIGEPTPALGEAPVAGSGLRWLMPFLRPHLKTLGLAFALALLAAGAEVAIPVLSGRLVDNGVLRGDRTIVAVLGSVLLVLAVISGAILFGQRRAVAKAGTSLDVDSLSSLTTTLLGVPMSYLETRRSGDLERRLTSMQHVNDVITRQGVDALTAAIQLVLILIVMFFYSVLLAGVFLAVVVAYMVLVRFAFVRIRPLYAALENALGQLAAKQVDLLKGIEAVKTAGRRPGIPEAVDKSLGEVRSRRLSSEIASGRLAGAIMGTKLAATALLLFLGALLVIDHQLTLGQFLAFNVLVGLALGPAQLLAALWDDVERSTAMLHRLQDVFEQEPEQADRLGRLRPVPSMGGRVELRGVGFAYGVKPGGVVMSDRDYVLRDIDLVVPEGKIVGLVGRSGSGKSTLLRLLTGLVEPTTGKILFDSVDMSQLDFGELRRRIGFVHQSSYLFDDTIAANIALGASNPDIDRVRQAAELADADHFIARLPFAYQTRVGDGGMRLSGGETQRVCLARALYFDPSVVLLDEATSSLDSEAERQVRDNLERALEGRTAFIVAHRISTVRHVDLIVVLDRGRIVETGTHDELMDRDSLYAYLYSRQIEA